MKKFFLFAFLSLVSLPAFSDVRHDQDMDVKVRIDGDDVLVDVNFAVPAPARVVWGVLTDFDHMASFITNVQSSKVTERSGNTMQVSQKGVAKHAMMTFPFESVREIQLFPYEKILSHMVSGTMRKMEGDTHLIGEGEQTRVVYHADTVPGVWIPPVLGKVFIEHETREQFQEIRDEILKRKQSETKQARLDGRRATPYGKRHSRRMQRVQAA